MDWYYGRVAHDGRARDPYGVERLHAMGERDEQTCN